MGRQTCCRTSEIRAFKIILAQKLFKNSQQNQIESGELVLKPWEKGETME